MAKTRKAIGNVIIPAKLDETATVVAQLYGVTDRYVRSVINGYEPKGKAGKLKARNIKTAYQQYKKGKTLLIQSIEKKVKIA